MAIIGNMSSREVLNFLSPNRKHMKDGLFEASDDALCFEFSGTTFKMSKETLSAIMGCKLTSEQFLAVDNTTLGELLKQEEGIVYVFSLLLQFFALFIYFVCSLFATL